MAITYFGNSDASGGGGAGTGIGSGGSLRGQVFAAPVSGNITQARAMLKDNGAGAPNVKVCVYASSAGAPTTRLGVSNPTAVAVGALTLYAFTFGTPVAVVSGTSYALMLIADIAVVYGYKATGTTYFWSTSYASPGATFAGSSFGGFQPALEMGIDDGAGGAVFVPRIIASY